MVFRLYIPDMPVPLMFDRNGGPAQYGIRPLTREVPSP